MLQFQRAGVWFVKTLFFWAALNVVVMSFHIPIWAWSLFMFTSPILVFWLSWRLEYRGGLSGLGTYLGKKVYEYRRSTQRPKVAAEIEARITQLLTSMEFKPEGAPEFHQALTAHGLTDERERNAVLLHAGERLVETLGRDRKLDDREWEVFLASRAYFNAPIPTDTRSPMHPGNLGDMRARGILSEGRLIEQHKDQMPVRLKDGEKVFWVVPALLVRRKKVTERINYSGITGSFGLGGGFRYRIGSIAPTVIKREVVETEDSGKLYITSERIGFQGNRKSWDASIRTIKDVQVEAADVGLEIFSGNRANPVCIFPAELDTTAAVISIVLNGDYEIASSNGQIPA